MNEGEQVGDVDEWEHEYGQNPYENLKRLDEQTPKEIPDEILLDVAGRSIAGMGRKTARRALERIRDTPDTE